MSSDALKTVYKSMVLAKLLYAAPVSWQRPDRSVCATRS